MNRFRVAAASAVLFGASVGCAWGSWAWVALEDRLIEADLVVVGKIGTIRDGDAAAGVSLGELQVSEVLKGDKGVKTVDLAFRGGRGLMPSASTDIAYKEGQEGIWILQKDKDWHWARYPKDFQKLAARESVAAMLESLARLEWGKAAGGLRLCLAVRQPTTPQDDGASPATRLATGKLRASGTSIELVFILRNDSNQTVTYCDYVADRPCSVDLATPSGKQTLNLYPRAGRPDVAEVTQRNFVPIRPGQTRIVHRWTHAFGQTGEHAFDARFASRQEGKGFRVENLWKGELQSNGVAVDSATEAPTPRPKPGG